MFRSRSGEHGFRLIHTHGRQASPGETGRVVPCSAGDVQVAPRPRRRLQQRQQAVGDARVGAACAVIADADDVVFDSAAIRSCRQLWTRWVDRLTASFPLRITRSPRPCRPWRPPQSANAGPHAPPSKVSLNTTVRRVGVITPTINRRMHPALTLGVSSGSESATRSGDSINPDNGWRSWYLKWRSTSRRLCLNRAGTVLSTCMTGLSPPCHWRWTQADVAS